MLSKSRLNSGFQRAKALHFSLVSSVLSHTFCRLPTASFYGAPSVGLSLDDHDHDADFDATIAFAERLIPAMLQLERPSTPLCLNVNVPVARPEEIAGHRICRQTRGFWKEEFFCHQDPRGRDYFWLTGSFCNHEPEAEETDEWALKHNYIAVVPIKVDLTDYPRMKQLEGLF